jgi:predicted Zn-dependent protease with MMP-like domain
MDETTRRWFDDFVEEVLDGAPPLIGELLEEVPLHVEDYPSEEVLREFNLADRRALCGLFSGVPFGERSIERSGDAPSIVTLYREGLIEQSRDRFGRIDPESLRKEIRITILHELGHLHDLTEDDLESMGY